MSVNTYLGTWLNQKLTVDTQLQQIAKKVDFIRLRLSPTLYNTSLDFRRNLWQIFILPLYEFILPIYHYEEAETNRAKVEVSLRKYFKSFTGLKKTVNNALLNDLMAYNLQKRSAHLAYISERKWHHRLSGESYCYWEDPDFEETEPMPNICKNQPKAMIKYINMQTALCSVCKSLNQPNARCSLEHLQTCHNIQIQSISSITKKVMQLTKTQERKKKGQPKMTRRQIVEYADGLIQPSLEKLRGSLTQKAA